MADDNAGRGAGGRRGRELWKFTVASTPAARWSAGDAERQTTVSTLSSGAATLSGTLDVAGDTCRARWMWRATLSSTLDVAGDVDVGNSRWPQPRATRWWRDARARETLGRLSVSTNVNARAVANTNNTVVAGTLTPGRP